MKIKRLFNSHILKLLIRKIFQKIFKKTPSNKPTKIDFEEVEIRNIKIDLQIRKENEELLRKLSEFYLKHEFEILGSGYCSFNKIDDNKDNDSYENLNWNIDIKSGYEWPLNKKLNTDEIFNLPEGVDVKMAWDFGRMNHLPQLAVMYMVSGEKRYKFEIENLVKDFYLNNKYLEGIQWTSAMDVGIRAMNIIISYYIVYNEKNKESYFDLEFINVLIKTIYEHGKYIYDNLEINFRNFDSGNHYLTNIVSLLYISYFIVTKETKKWWNFAEKEFSNLLKEQFSCDGSYYEGSTNYHRLATELSILGASILVRKNNKISCKILNTLIKAANFIDDLSFNNHIVQIGDNDSGRIIKLTPLGNFISQKDALDKYINLQQSRCKKSDNLYFDEDLLDYRPTISMILGLINDLGYNDYKKLYSLEHDLINSIANKKIKHNFQRKELNHKSKAIKLKYPKSSYKKVFKNKLINPENGRWILYENFGVICYKTKDIFVSLRLNGNRKKKPGHTHNDIFSLNIILKDDLKVVDPGSYSYTNDAKFRYLFRTDEAHSAPLYNKKAVNIIDVFSMKSNVTRDSLVINDDSCEYTCVFEGIKHKRKIKITQEKIEIIDIGTDHFTVDYDEFIYYSNGYGKLLKRERMKHYENFDAN